MSDGQRDQREREQPSTLLQTLIRIDQEPGKAADHSHERCKVQTVAPSKTGRDRGRHNWRQKPTQAAKSRHYAGDRSGAFCGDIIARGP